MAEKKSKRRRHRKKPEKLERLRRKIEQGPYDGQFLIDGVFEKGLPNRDTELIAGLREIVDSLVARKKAYFSKYRRQIIDFDVQDLGDHYYISVASTIEDDGSQGTE